jgi:putative transposase
LGNLPQRKNIRLKDYDYSKNGAYFITICTKNKLEFLWMKSVGACIARPHSSCQQLSSMGMIVENAINKIHEKYYTVSVDKYVIMPNHIHIILILQNGDGRAMHAPTISIVINQMKGYVTKQIGFSIWQKLFHDHIIRSETEYQKIWDYIETNPQKWQDDCYYLESTESV